MARMCDYGLLVATTSTWSWRGAVSWTTVMRSKWQLGRNTNLMTTVWVEFCCCLSVVVSHRFSSLATSSWDDCVADRTHLQCLLVIAGGGGGGQRGQSTGRTLVSFISHFCLIVNYALFQEVWQQDIVCLFALLCCWFRSLMTAIAWWPCGWSWTCDWSWTCQHFDHEPVTDHEHASPFIMNLWLIMNMPALSSWLCDWSWTCQPFTDHEHASLLLIMNLWLIMNLPALWLIMNKIFL